MEIAEPCSAAATRMGSHASRPGESVQAWRAEIAAVIKLSKKTTYTTALEASDVNEK